jgi:DNA recombination protein RmuC
VGEVTISLELAWALGAGVAALALLGLGVWFVRSSRAALAAAEKAVREELRLGREESALIARDLRKELGEQLGALTASNEQRLERLRGTLDAQLQALQQGNEKKLDEMRRTVDEKLQGTLEKRLGESFKLVSERLEAVHKGLGEMQGLAAGVGDLKRVLSNVKTRGTFGEVQLGAILEQVLTPGSVRPERAPRDDSREVVEYAIKLPGPDSERSRNV